MLFHKRQFLGRSGLRCRAALLAALIAVTAVLPGVSAHAERLDDEAFRSEIVGGTFRPVAKDFEVSMAILPDGLVVLNSPIGSFDGEWSTAGETVCMYFPRGPLLGGNCTGVTRLGAGYYETGDGLTIHRVASAHPA